MSTPRTPGPWVIAPTSRPGNGPAWRDIHSTGAQYSPAYVGEAIYVDAEFIVRACNCHEDLLAAAMAVIARWDTPLWKDAASSGSAINALREAVAKAEGKS